MSKRPSCVLGVAGGSGSGKSWLANFLKQKLKDDAVIVCLDWYYKDNGHLPPDEVKKLNVDHPSALDMSLFVRDVDRLIEGETIEAPRYDYATHSRLPEIHTVRPAPVIILEGLFILHDARLRKRLDLGVFIDFPDDLRLIRRVKRDVEHRRIDLEETLRIYEHCVRPMHRKFIQPSGKHATHVWKQAEDKAFPGKFLKLVRARV